MQARLKVMTPLLGTKNPSAPVGDKSGGDRRAARSLLSCAWWRGIGRLWRGMGGMGRPEPLSAHRPRRQQRLSGFHETRDPRPETRLLPGAPRKPARVPRFFTNHETRITNHGLLSKHGFLLSQPSSIDQLPSEAHEALDGWLRDPAITQTAATECTNALLDDLAARQASGPLASWGMYEARENEWKGVFLNPETGITTFSESGFGSRFGIPHYPSEFVGKIRISSCRQSSAPAHCGNRDIGFMDASRPRVTFPGPQVSPSGEVKGERVTNRESRLLCFLSKQGLLVLKPFSLFFRIDRHSMSREELFLMSRDASSMAQTKARPTGPPAFPGSLLFSPRGEAKWVRGPSGLGASRAEEKGASRLACAGVLEQYVEHGKQAQRSPGARIACFGRRVLRHAGYGNPTPRPTVFHETRDTKHESRLLCFLSKQGLLVLKPFSLFFLAPAGIASGEEPFLRSRDAKIRGANKSKVPQSAGVSW